jgi:hypothetical protein
MLVTLRQDVSDHVNEGYGMNLSQQHVNQAGTNQLYMNPNQTQIYMNNGVPHQFAHTSAQHVQFNGFNQTPVYPQFQVPTNNMQGQFGQFGQLGIQYMQQQQQQQFHQMAPDNYQQQQVKSYMFQQPNYMIPQPAVQQQMAYSQQIHAYPPQQASYNQSISDPATVAKAKYLVQLARNASLQTGN